jgi:NAD(P)-dependent dehydrogenase (short-subunit alcohol dehydrogenase family)
VPANSGIGFELTAQLLAKTNPTYHIFLCARSPDKGHTALKDLQSRKLPGTAELLHVDMTNDDTINRAVESITNSHGKLDVLVNNAAVSIPEGSLRKQMNEAFDTNATGPLVLTEAIAHLLKKGSDARIINISSGIGSIGRKLDPSGPMHKVRGEPYRASKTALNMITACQFVEYGQFGIKVSVRGLNLCLVLIK